MTRVDAVYVRKSTTPQEEQSQIDAIQDYLNRNSLAVDADYWFMDTGSRHRPEDRPDFQKMLALLEQKRIRRVYVWKQDRIVSGVKLWGHIMYLFEKAGTQLIDILTGKDLAADDIATEITTVVNARGAKEEQIKSPTIRSGPRFRSPRKECRSANFRRMGTTKSTQTPPESISGLPTF